MFFASRLSFVCTTLLAAFGSANAATSEDASVLTNEVARANNDSLLWGPYKPNLYFGVRPRIPKSLAAGLMWAKLDNYMTAQGSMQTAHPLFPHVSLGFNLLTLREDFRHTCEQNEGMAGYGWEEYDIRKGGRQTVHDTGNSIDMTIDFVKVPGGVHGGSWAARVKGVPRESAPANLYTTVVFYTSLEGLGSIEVDKGDDDEDSVGFEGDVKLKGMTPDLGDFSIDVTSGPDTNEHPKFTHPSYDEKPLYHSFVSSLQMPPEHLWQAKSRFGLLLPFSL